jgi:hypothetical protein
VGTSGNAGTGCFVGRLGVFGFDLAGPVSLTRLGAFDATGSGGGAAGCDRDVSFLSGPICVAGDLPPVEAIFVDTHPAIETTKRHTAAVSGRIKRRRQLR